MAAADTQTEDLLHSAGIVETYISTVWKENVHTIIKHYRTATV